MNRTTIALALAILVPAAAYAQPDPVTDLRVLSAIKGEVVLNWTAPTGLPTVPKFLGYGTYEVYYSDIDPAGEVDAWWAGATLWSVTPVTRASGTPESLVITGLDTQKPVWFVVRACDGESVYKYEEYLWSELSNVAVSYPENPDAPISPLQYKRDGSTLIPGGGSTDQSGFVVKAKVQDPAGRLCRLQAELKTAAGGFDGDGIVTGAEGPSGSTASVAIEGLVPSTSYQWRIRTINSTGGISPWVGIAGADLATAAIDPPSVLSPDQKAWDSGATIGLGYRVIGEAVGFEAVLVQLNGHEVKLEIEVQPIGKPFTNEATTSSLPSASASAGTAVARLAPGFYHWQARAVELEWGVASAWAGFGGNGEDEADFELVAPGSTGNATCLGSATASGAWIAVFALILAIRLR